MQKVTYRAGRKVLLYSGGMDSWLIDKIWQPDVRLYVDMCTQYSREEIDRLPSRVIIQKLDLSRWEREDKIIPLRNIFLIGIACNYGDDICLGATAGDRILDKSIKFGKKYQDLLQYLYQEQHWTERRNIRVNLSFKRFTKTQLLRMYLDKGGDINEAFTASFSCYTPIHGHPCWQCKPCYRKFVAFWLNGYKFDSSTISAVISYIRMEILPQIKEKTYGRKQEEKEILKVLEYYKDYV